MTTGISVAAGAKFTQHLDARPAGEPEVEDHEVHVS